MNVRAFFIGDDGSRWDTDENGSWARREALPLAPPEDGAVILDATGWDLLCQYMSAKASRQMWADMEAEAKAALVKIIGPATNLHYRGRRVMNVIRTRPRRLDRDAFDEAYPGLLDQFRTEPDEDVVRFDPVKDVTYRPAPTRDTA